MGEEKGGQGKAKQGGGRGKGRTVQGRGGERERRGRREKVILIVLFPHFRP